MVETASLDRPSWFVGDGYFAPSKNTCDFVSGRLVCSSCSTWLLHIRGYLRRIRKRNHIAGAFFRQNHLKSFFKPWKGGGPCFLVFYKRNDQYTIYYIKPTRLTRNKSFLNGDVSCPVTESNIYSYFSSENHIYPSSVDMKWYGSSGLLKTRPCQWPGGQLLLTMICETKLLFQLTGENLPKFESSH